jgi:hypothetical protein
MIAVPSRAFRGVRYEGVLPEIASRPSPKVPRRTLDLSATKKRYWTLVSKRKLLWPLLPKAGQLIVRIHQLDRDLAADRDIRGPADC